MRPVFQEVSGFLGSRYKRIGNEPYGIIVGEKGNGAALSGFNPVTVVDAAVKDIFRPFNAIIDTVGDKLNVKTLKHKEYACRLSSGRITKVYLENVPAVLITKDNERKDVYKDTPLQREIREDVAPYIANAKVLQIQFNLKREDLLVYEIEDRSVSVEDMGRELKMAVLSYQAYLQQEKQKLGSKKKGLLNLPRIELPEISIRFGNPRQETRALPDSQNEGDKKL